MKTIKNTLLVLISACLLMACVQVNTVTTNKTQLAVSSARDLPLTYAQGSLFALDPKHLAHISIKEEQEKAVYGLYEKAIIRDLEKNGYRLAANGEKANFHIGFLLALSEDLSDRQISEQFGVMPGLPVKGEDDKGSLLIYVEDSALAERVWRSTVQGFVRTDLSDIERDKRSQKVVETALAQFYQK